MAVYCLEVNQLTVDFLHSHSSTDGDPNGRYYRTRNLFLWLLRNDPLMIDNSQGKWFELLADASQRTVIRVFAPRAAVTTLLFKSPLPRSAIHSFVSGAGLFLDAIAADFIRFEPQIPAMFPHSFDFTKYRFSPRAVRAFRFLINTQLKTYDGVATELSTLTYHATVDPIRLPFRTEVMRLNLAKEPMTRLAYLVPQFNIKASHGTPHAPNLALEAILSGYLLPDHPDYEKILAYESH